jgi:hypothetical protein
MSLQNQLYFGGMALDKSLAEKLATDPPGTVSSGAQKVWKALFASADIGRYPGGVVRFIEVMDNAWMPTMDRLWAGELTPQQTGQAIASEGTRVLQS